MSTAMKPKERPILYSGAMVRAILDGIKTQTRRVIRDLNLDRSVSAYRDGAGGWIFWDHDRPGLEEDTKIRYPDGGGVKCPYGKPGDRLWVREAFALSVRDPEGLPFEDDPSNWDVVYKTEGDSGKWVASEINEGGGLTTKRIKAPWRPSIHMPRRLCRIVLEITEVRVQRIQDITDDDIRSEGVAEYARSKGLDPERINPRAAWIDLWDSINAGRDGAAYAWDKNPWTWAISFKRVEGAARE